MNARFELRPSPRPRDKGEPVEYVEIVFGADVVHRVATDADRERFRAEYAEFKKGPPPKAPPAAEAVEPPPDFMPGFVEAPPAAEAPKEEAHAEEAHHHKRGHKR